MTGARERLDAIVARLEAIGAGEEISGSRLGALTDDLAAMHAAVTAVMEVHRPGEPECSNQHHDATRCPCAVSYCDACGDPAPCTTTRAVEAAFQPKDRS